MLFYPVAAQVSLAAVSIYCGLLVFHRFQSARDGALHAEILWTVVTRLLPSGALVSAWTSWRDVVRVAAMTSGATQAQFTLPDSTSIEYVYRLPTTPAKGLVLLFHGCRQSPRVWFAPSPNCTACLPRPEERCMADRLFAAGYAGCE